MKPIRRTLTMLLPLFVLLAVAPASAQQARVYGTVTSTAGSPVEGAKLTLTPVDKGTLATAKTNKKGKFMLGLVRPGKYAVGVEAPGMILKAFSGKATNSEKKVDWDQPKADLPEGKPLELGFEDGQEVTLELVMAPAVQVGGGGGGPTLSAEGALQAIVPKAQGGDCAGALADLESVLAASPEMAAAHYLKGYCLAQTGKPEDAVASLTRALEIDPATPGACLLKGQVLGRLGRFDEAEALIRTDLEKTTDPEMQKNAWIALGVLLREAGKTDAAIEAFTKVTELAPTQPESYVELTTLYMKAGKPDMAEQVLEKARQAGVLDSGALLNVGITYLNNKDYEHAQAAFQKVIDAGGSNEDLSMAWSLLARTNLHAGRMDEAVTMLERALELDPNSRLAEENREILAQLKQAKK